MAYSVQIKNILESGTNIRDRFIPDYNELKAVVEDLKRMGYRIVLTQGVFDLLHEGHALYLEKARSYGDILIVGVDTDRYTRQRKGPNRPIVPQIERINMLIHLRHVSIITLRDLHQEKGALIEAVRPNVLITSESTRDFPPEDMEAYREMCGEIVILPPQATTHTSARIRLLSIDGADQLAKELSERVPKLVQETLDKLRGV
jgi:D-beta-D-heptose 7-phosphate kinase/D-beta-D-heptose 1-phosphate adenosyltransferase